MLQCYVPLDPSDIDVWEAGSCKFESGTELLDVDTRYVSIVSGTDD